MRGDTPERVRSRCDRPWPFGLQRCRGIWPEDSANSPPATRRMPPSSETDTESFGIQELCKVNIWCTDAESEQKPVQLILK